MCCFLTIADWDEAAEYRNFSLKARGQKCSNRSNRNILTSHIFTVSICCSHDVSRPHAVLCYGKCSIHTSPCLLCLCESFSPDHNTEAENESVISSRTDFCSWVSQSEQHAMRSVWAAQWVIEIHRVGLWCEVKASHVKPLFLLFKVQEINNTPTENCKDTNIWHTWAKKIEQKRSAFSVSLATHLHS